MKFSKVNICQENCQYLSSKIFLSSKVLKKAVQIHPQIEDLYLSSEISITFSVKVFVFQSLVSLYSENIAYDSKVKTCSEDSNLCATDGYFPI